jgi:hypothetical protein
MQASRPRRPKRNVVLLIDQKCTRSQRSENLILHALQWRFYDFGGVDALRVLPVFVLSVHTGILISREVLLKIPAIPEW